VAAPEGAFEGAFDDCFEFCFDFWLRLGGILRLVGSWLNLEDGGEEKTKERESFDLTIT